MKRDKRISKLARKIVALEREIATADDPTSAQEELLKLSGSLTIEEMLAVDEYIQANSLLR